MTSDSGMARHELAPDGVLPAAINLGNPVLAQGTVSAPTGVTVDIARELASRLGVELDFLSFDAARKSFDALVDGSATVGFLAVEPARATDVTFSAPYLVIEGVFVVPAESGLLAAADVDRSGVRIGVKDGSAYDLFLSRTVQHAELQRGAEGIEIFREHNLEVGAGIRQPVTDFVATHPEYRMLPERFMQIQQAVAVSRSSSAETVAFVSEFVNELKTSGFIAESLLRSGQDAGLVAD